MSERSSVPAREPWRCERCGALDATVDVTADIVPDLCSNCATVALLAGHSSVPAPEARRLYADMVAFIESRGWRREEVGSGWWISPTGAERVLPEAVEEILDAEGIDTREPPAEPPAAVPDPEEPRP